jgi:hypothetical protein
MLVLYRRPLRESPPTTRTGRTAAVRAARKNEIFRGVVSEPFSKWRAKQLAKMKSRDAFPTQEVWYVRTALALKASRYVSHSDLTNCLA